MSTTGIPPSPSLFRHLVLDNPMTLEATRAWRRFIRSGSDTRKGANVTALIFVTVMYTWCLFAILRFHEDMSTLLITLEALLLTLVVPGSMYAAISGERERLTWDGLIMTSLSPGQIVAGKLLWRVVLILGVAALFVPPLLLCQFAAGILSSASSIHQEYTLDALFFAQGLVVTWGLLLAGFSLLISTKTKRAVTTLAIVTIALLGFLVIVPSLVGMFGGYNDWRFSQSPLAQLGSLMLHLHPYDSIWHLGKDASISSIGSRDEWARREMVRFVPWIYLSGAFACVFGAWKTLRGLEEPRVRS